ncbi:ABC transporter permease [Paenarthrobacter nicotinovorans]|uniref:ABC transporter permease n=1 Tax=Paenarthrobacter nicotinovorans TaxID=29320 RepID=UPI00381105F4
MTGATFAHSGRGASTGIRERSLQVLARFGLPIVLVIVILLAGATTPSFFSFDNFRAVLINTAIVGIIAVATTPVTLSGNFFSLGTSQSVMLGALTFLALISNGWPLPVAGIAVVAFLVIIGVAQGIIVAAGLNPVITTLGAGAVIFGAATVLSGGSVVTAGAQDIGWIATASLWGLPLPVYGFLIFTLATMFVTDRTIIGRQIVMVGANKETARVSGISVRKATLAAFSIMSFGFALAGILAAAQTTQVTSSDFGNLTIDTVAAVLVGGTAVTGGQGSPARSAIGALLVVVIGNVMLLNGFTTGARAIGVGALVAVMVCVLHVIGKVTKK